MSMQNKSRKRTWQVILIFGEFSNRKVWLSKTFLTGIISAGKFFTMNERSIPNRFSKLNGISESKSQTIGGFPFWLGKNWGCIMRGNIRLYIGFMLRMFFEIDRSSNEGTNLFLS